MVLEAIYKPIFQDMNCSFGFRASNGCREAIVSIRENSQGFTTAIEGDIEKAYPNMDCEILMKILKIKIKDQRFLNLVRERLNRIIFDTKNEKYEETFLGLPQGGVDSPILWNLYLLGMDEFIISNLNKKVEEINNTRLKNREKAKPNPQWLRLKSKIDAKVKNNNKCKKDIKYIKSLIDVEIKINQSKITVSGYGKRKSEFLDIENKILYVTSQKVKDRVLRDISEENIMNIQQKILINNENINELKKQRIKINYVSQNNNKIRYHYVRYADDFIILGNFSKKLAQTIKTELIEWLKVERKAKLSMEKTLITDLFKGEAKFLGYEIKATKTRKIRILTNNNKQYSNNKKYARRVAGSNLIIGPDKTRMINRLFIKGFCDKKGFPISMPWLTNFETHIIIERFNAILRGIAEYYAEFITRKHYLNRWLYIIRWCCIKTIAQKYNTKIKKIFKMFGSNGDNIKAKYIILARDKENNVITLEKNWELLKAKDVLNLANKGSYIEIANKLKTISNGEFIFTEGKINNRTPRIMDKDYLNRINWINLRTQASFDMPCAVCGSMENIEMHHVKSIKKGKISLIPNDFTIKKMMVLRNRRQCPLCSKCHLKYHNLEMENEKSKIIKLSKPIVKLYDNRILDIERFIQPGEIYQALPMPEVLFKRGWKEISK